MTLKNFLAYITTAGLLTGALLSTPAVAQSDTGFSAMQGVEAKALSADEMQAIHGLISQTNINELTLRITLDPNLDPKAKELLLAVWGQLAKLDGTKYEILADKFFLLMQKRYPGMCGLNADFCTQ